VKGVSNKKMNKYVIKNTFWDFYILKPL